MLVIGLTGGIGSGKSAVSDLFEQKGIHVVDADIAAREVVEPDTPALKKITEHFGQEILTTEGRLDRPKLREIIFNNPDEKSWLEALLHPLIADCIHCKLTDSNTPYTLFVSPLLLETQQKNFCDRILLVDAPESVQILRTIKRDNNDEALVKSIINSQMPRDKRVALADDIILNDKDLLHLEKSVDKLHATYLKLACEGNQ
jgi:dephospho-CoA kinase